MSSDYWSGCLLAVRGDRVLLEECAGSSAPHRPNEPTTRFQAGSVSKQFVAVIILQLLDQQVVSLQDPVRTWLPEVPAVWGDLTLHQLLSHTSGLGHWGDIPGLDLGSPPPPDALRSLLEAAPAVAAPGERHVYSGPGYLLAARVAEAVTAHAYGDLVHQLIVDRVAMPRTSSGVFPLGQDGVAYGLRAGQPVEVAEIFTQLPGTGDLWTTAWDLTRFAQSLRTDLISASARELMWGSHADVAGQAPAEESGRPIVVGSAGYGVFTGTVLGHQAILSAGDNPGYRSLLAWLPELDLDLVILSNDDAVGLDVTLTQLAEALS